MEKNAAISPTQEDGGEETVGETTPAPVQTEGNHPDRQIGTVTISASYGAHGDTIGHAVAERLGLPFLDRAIPNGVARRLHLSDRSAENLDERAPGRWNRFVRSFVGLDVATEPVDPFEPPDLFEPVDLLSDPIESVHSFRLATEAMLRQAADTTGAVVLGRCGMVVLGGRDDVLSVRLDGSLEARIAGIVAGGTDEATARQTETDVDGAREHYASFFYKVRQNDIRLYHLIIDSTVLPVAACVDLIAMAAEVRFNSITDLAQRSES